MSHSKFLVGALLAVISTALFAEDRLDVEYYDIEGADLYEMRASLDALGPMGENGKRFHGFTKWRVNWNYYIAPDGGGCRVTTLDTHVVATITMPRWDAPREASAELRKKWRNYVRDLRAHEDGHHEIALRASEQIRDELADLTSSSCAALRREIDVEANAILDIYRAEEKAYDSDTRHGATQGARF